MQGPAQVIASLPRAEWAGSILLFRNSATAIACEALHAQIALPLESQCVQVRAYMPICAYVHQGLHEYCPKRHVVFDRMETLNLTCFHLPIALKGSPRQFLLYVIDNCYLSHISMPTELLFMGILNFLVPESYILPLHAIFCKN